MASPLCAREMTSQDEMEALKEKGTGNSQGGNTGDLQNEINVRFKTRKWFSTGSHLPPCEHPRTAAPTSLWQHNPANNRLSLASTRGVAGRFFTIWATTSLELWANTPTTHYSVNREKHKGQSLGCSKCSSPGNDPNILLPSTSTFVLQAQFPEITPITWGSFPWYSLISISAVHQDFCYSSLADCLSAE